MQEFEKIILRKITDNDKEILFNIYASTRIEEFRDLNWPDYEVYNFLYMQFEMQHKQYTENYSNSTLDLVLLEDNPIGRLYINREDDDIRIIDIAILPHYRKMGFGSYLMNNLINESESTNKTLSLHVEFNNPVKKWYEKLGFTKEHEVGVYHFMKRRIF